MNNLIKRLGELCIEKDNILLKLNRCKAKDFRIVCPECETILCEKERFTDTIRLLLKSRRGENAAICGKCKNKIKLPDSRNKLIRDGERLEVIIPEIEILFAELMKKEREQVLNEFKTLVYCIINFDDSTFVSDENYDDQKRVYSLTVEHNNETPLDELESAYGIFLDSMRTTLSVKLIEIKKISNTKFRLNIHQR